MKNLKSALKSKSYKSACITIPKSLDGRIQVRTRAILVKWGQIRSLKLIFSFQVYNKKAQPHLLFCQIWRWPDIKQHGEIRGLCKMGHGQCVARICINPYHYWRQKEDRDPNIEAYFLDQRRGDM